MRLICLASLDNKSIYSNDDVLKRLFTVTSYDAEVQKIVTREWTRVKTGR
jgi:putrescine transport system substrate-binding protein